jgi:hypothetical protein
LITASVSGAPFAKRNSNTFHLSTGVFETLIFAGFVFSSHTLHEPSSPFVRVFCKSGFATAPERQE